MHRPHLSTRLASLMVLLAACPGDAPIEPSTSTDTSTGSATEVDSTTTPTTTKGPTTTAPDTDTDPTTTDPTTTSPTTTGPATITDTSTGDTSTGDTSTGDTSTGDTSTGDTSTGDTDTSTGTSTGTDTSTGTTEPAAACDGAAIEPGEVCDGADLDGQTCNSQGFDGGTLACAVDCLTFDTTGCFTMTCDDGVLQGDEVCDGALLGGETCLTQGFDGGTLACAPGCAAFDTSGCTDCGNDNQEGAELCDGVDLDGQTCNSQGFTAGELTCNADCAGYNTDACTTCGDNTQQGNEECDGADLDGQTCAALGFTAGQLGCTPACLLDIVPCTLCGDNDQEGAEACDGTDLAGQTCASQGFQQGNLTCQADCSALDTTNCSSCGNGMVEAAEVCDGANLNGQTCVSLGGGNTGGTLSCNTGCAGFNQILCDAAIDETEPNDDGTPSSGNDFNVNVTNGPITKHTLIHAAIQVTGDDDVFAVTNTTGSPATLRAETFGPGGAGTCAAPVDTVINVRLANGAVIATDDEDGINSCSLIQQSPDNVVLLPGQTVYVQVIDFLEDGTIPSYFLDIRLIPLVCGDGTAALGEYCDDGNLINGDGCSSTCHVEGAVPEIEPNNTNPEADATGQVSNGTSLYEAAIANPGDIDRFRIDIAATSHLRFETFSKLRDCVGSFDTELELYDANNVIILPGATDELDDAGISLCSALGLTLNPGTYYARITEFGNDGLLPTYLFEVKAHTDVGTETEPNDNLATASTNIQNGSDVMVFGDHSTVADLDWYAINVPVAGSSIRVELIEGDRAVETCESNGIDSRLTLFNSTGTNLGNNGDSGRGFCSLIDGTGTTPANSYAHNLAAGTYYVQVNAQGAAAAGQFTYRLLTTVRTP